MTLLTALTLNLYLVLLSALLNCPGSCRTLHLCKSPFSLHQYSRILRRLKIKLFIHRGPGFASWCTDRPLSLRSQIFSSLVKYSKVVGRVSSCVPTRSFPTQISHYPISLISQIVDKEIICTDSTHNFSAK